MSFFATAAKGTEPALRDELRELGLPGVRADRGGVHFEGGLGEGALACLASRIAVRVLYELGSFDAADGDALYDGVRGVDWRAYLTADRTLAVRASCRSSALTHTQFIAQRTKDAVVDQLRGRTGERPSVDLADPDVALFVHLVRDRATLYVDLAGEPLHRRGYRRRNVTAPLKETLAAAILRLSGWDRRSPLLDPMCGSGTIAIEAALWAAGVAPGLARPRLGLERWAMHDEAGARAMADLRARLREPARREAPSIVASDHDPAAIEATTENARAAGVSISVLRRSLVARHQPAVRRAPPRHRRARGRARPRPAARGRDPRRRPRPRAAAPGTHLRALQRPHRVPALDPVRRRGAQRRIAASIRSGSFGAAAVRTSGSPLVTRTSSSIRIPRTSA